MIVDSYLPTIVDTTVIRASPDTATINITFITIIKLSDPQDIVKSKYLFIINR